MVIEGVEDSQGFRDALVAFSPLADLLDVLELGRTVETPPLDPEQAVLVELWVHRAIRGMHEPHVRFTVARVPSDGRPHQEKVLLRLSGEAEVSHGGAPP